MSSDSKKSRRPKLEAHILKVKPTSSVISSNAFQRLIYLPRIMHLHGIRALGSLALLFTITSAAPADNGIEAKSDLVARDTWSDGYGPVPVGSFSFIIDPEGTITGKGFCTVTIKTQEYPSTGRVCHLNNPTSGSATTDCGKAPSTFPNAKKLNCPSGRPP